MPTETVEGNRLLRATLTLAGVDPSAIVLVDEPAGVAALTAERLAPQDLLLRSMRVNTEAGEKLAEASAEITMLYAEIDDLTVQLAEEQKVRGEVEDLRLGWELGEIELTDLERDNERLRARIRWLESELTAHHVHVASQEPPGQIVLPGSVVETLELAARLPFLSIGATSDAAAGLDVHPQAERWATKIWQALAALNAYAEGRSAGTWPPFVPSLVQRASAGRRRGPGDVGCTEGFGNHHDQTEVAGSAHLRGAGAGGGVRSVLHAGPHQDPAGRYAVSTDPLPRRHRRPDRPHPHRLRRRSPSHLGLPLTPKLTRFTWPSPTDPKPMVATQLLLVICVASSSLRRLSMRILVLSDHGGKQLGRTVAQLRDAETTVAAWHDSYLRARQDLDASRRRTSWWRRLLEVSTAEERQASARTRQAWQGVAAADAGRQRLDGRARQQAAGVSGEEALQRGLSVLDDSWVMLRGYRNRRGETDHVLVGPGGVWAVEVKRRRVRLHAVGEHWWYEKFDSYGNLVDKGLAVDGGGRSWARQVNDVAADLAAWLARNDLHVPIHTAVMIMHERATLGRCENPTVRAIGTHPTHLLEAIDRYAVSLDSQSCERIVALIRRDHRFHERRRGGSGGRGDRRG
ncbi:nuclease-related domain-containing protein [Plantactinospora mayteni]|uniref:nuclease-related domain-containing protein n=1 Tax=Plantactinospora mayteni TaxID=566021 RepID=UPI001942B49F|nr:nuclease-related domain-containing protein [Plantactinospora mayteni]